jgi:transposase InsO family protein
VRLAKEYPVKVVCEAIELARSTYYSQPKPKRDEHIKGAIERVAEAWPKYGYRRVTQQLKREGWKVNSKKVRRLMGEMGLLVKKKAPKRHTTQSRHAFKRYPNLIKGIEITHPDQVWAADITYIRLRKGFVYLAVIMDIFTRSIRGWHLGQNLDHQLTLIALRKALQLSKPNIHHSDQGIQYAANVYVKYLKQNDVEISMSEIGQVTQNGYVERLIRTIKEEEVYLSDYENYQDAYDQIGLFIEDVYNHKRIHSSLGYLTPIEYEYDWRTRLSSAVVVP